jgi:hypothetical protein
MFLLFEKLEQNVLELKISCQDLYFLCTQCSIVDNGMWPLDTKGTDA